MISLNLQKNSIRTVAVFEAVKGAVVLAVGFGFLRLLHKDVHRIACEFITRVHLNPAHKYPTIFIDLASNITDHKLWLFAGLALIYSAFRFVEGYGLWKERAWAEWLAVVSGTVYLPIEMYEIYVKVSLVRVLALVANIVVVGVVAYVMINQRSLQNRIQASRSLT
jgi:uncharacterized membrane protein (DUF2068 family)